MNTKDELQKNVALKLILENHFQWSENMKNTLQREKMWDYVAIGASKTYEKLINLKVDKYSNVMKFVDTSLNELRVECERENMPDEYRKSMEETWTEMRTRQAKLRAEQMIELCQYKAKQKMKLTKIDEIVAAMVRQNLSNMVLFSLEKLLELDAQEKLELLKTVPSSSESPKLKDKDLAKTLWDVLEKHC